MPFALKRKSGGKFSEQRSPTHHGGKTLTFNINKDLAKHSGTLAPNLQQAKFLHAGDMPSSKPINIPRQTFICPKDGEKFSPRPPYRNPLRHKSHIAGYL